MEAERTEAVNMAKVELEKLDLDDDSEARIKSFTMAPPHSHSQQKRGPAVSENDVWFSLSLTDTSLHRRNLRHGGPTTLKVNYYTVV